MLGRGQVSRLGIIRRSAFPFRVEQWPCSLVRFTVTGIVRKSHPVPLTRAHLAARRTRGAAASAYSSVRGYYNTAAGDVNASPAAKRGNYAVSMALSAWRLSISTACSRILYFRILPAAFMGKASTKET